MDTNRFRLPQTIDPVQRLDVIGGVPIDVQDDGPVRPHEVDADAAGLGRHEQQPGRRQLVVEELDCFAARILGRLTVDSVVVSAGLPIPHLDDVVLPLTRLVAHEEVRRFFRNLGNL